MKGDEFVLQRSARITKVKIAQKRFETHFLEDVTKQKLLEMKF